MAKKSKSITFKNATISKSDGTICEISKESMRVFSLDNLLEEWDGIEGLSISIRLDEDAPEDGE